MLTRFINLLLIPVLLLTACGRTPSEQAARGITELNEGRHQDAAEQLDDVLTTYPNSFTPADRATLQTALALANDRAGLSADTTEVALEEAVIISPNQFVPLFNLGAFLLDANRQAEARPYLERASRADPSRTEALELLAHEALVKGDHANAINWLEQARARKESAPVLTALAVARKNVGRTDEIRALLQQATTLDPAYAPAKLSLAAYLDANRIDPEQAISNYEAYLRLEPDNPLRPHVTQRVSIMADRISSGDSVQPDPVRKEVEDLLQKAKQSQTANPALTLRLCLQANAIASRNAREDLKERSLRAAATLVPDSARGHFGLGRFLLEQKRFPEALRSLTQANTLAPEWPAPLKDLVPLAVEQGQVNAARNALSRSEQAVANNPDTLLDIARLYQDTLRLPREARRIRQAWLERFPDHPRQAEVNAQL